MFRNILFGLLLIISVQAQLNGEFWWLNSKLNNLRKVRPSPPKIEISEFQNDERSKVIFRDDGWPNKNLKPISDRTSKLKFIDNSDENKIIWPTTTVGHMKNHDVEVFYNKNNNMTKFDKVTKPSKIRNNYDDIIVFDYHKNDKFITVDSNKVETKSIYSTIAQSVTDKILKPISDQTSKLKVTLNSDENKVAWPTDEHMKNHNVEVFTDKNYLIKADMVEKPSKFQNKYEDSLVFSYPKKDKLVNVDSNKVSPELFLPTSSQIKLETERDNTSIEISLNADKSEKTVKHKESQNICTYTEKEKCNKLNGFVYVYARRIPTTSSGEPLVCCILPIQPVHTNENISKSIISPNKSSNLKRFKRSDNRENIALKQRVFLLKHKMSTQRQSVKPASTPLKKIVTSPVDDYVDPYWNIKNNKFQISTKPQIESTKYDYDSEDYEQEYTEEVPKPGLVGLYSDHVDSPSRWQFAGGSTGISYGGSNDDYEESDEYDDNDTFGYSTIDPRRGTKKPKHKRKPIKLTTASDEIFYDAESHTVYFQSNPDFHIFQGFKLLNLYRNSTRVYNKNTIKASKPNQSKEVLVSSVENSEESGEFFYERQLFESCGKVAVTKVNDNGNQIGEAEIGSHPWLMLVVLTERRHNVLCYATLVHPRTAVTVGDCVQGTAPGDITVIAGLWDLTDRSQSRNRIASVHVHPRYNPGDVENNLAVLYWTRPLKLNTNIQPACLGEPKIDEQCKFFGWGGFGQGIQQHQSRWQRATIKTCNSRPGIKRTRSSVEAFCVSTTRGTVTGMGGPLICDVGGHSSIVGVLVSKESGYVLSPVQDWTLKTENLISGD